MEDEEVAESWEEAADSGEIERRLEAKLMISQKEKKSNSGSGRSPMRTAIVIQDDSQPAAPPPQIRILKRPTSNGSLGSGTTSTRPVPQVKSLAQREAEYAEARRRILGSATPRGRASGTPQRGQARARERPRFLGGLSAKQSRNPPADRPRRHTRLSPTQIEGGEF